MNGHKIQTTKGVAAFDYYSNMNDDTFIMNVSCFNNKGTLTLTGTGEVGGPGGWFGIYNEGTLILDGPSLKGGTIVFDVGVTVPFEAYGHSENATLVADGYSYKSGKQIYSRD